MEPKYYSKLEDQIFFIFTKVDLNSNELTQLKKVVDVENISPFSSESFDFNFSAVVPRKGTISPWASKATDIAHNCGLENVELIERGVVYSDNETALEHCDKMVSQLLDSTYFELAQSKSHLERVESIEQYNKENSGTLSEEEIVFLNDYFESADRMPYDVELMMFEQVNSEHCRHKIFNADWEIDGEKSSESLFKKIRATYEQNDSTHVLSAYKDNAAAFKSSNSAKDEFFEVDPKTKEYKLTNEPTNIVLKAETHNHPTAVAPYPGAATGVGGEIRDEAAVGIGSKSKAGICGFTVSNISFEKDYYKDYPKNIVNPLQIMIDAPLGGYDYGNEFGRVTTLGYFRTFQQKLNGINWGFHKPQLIAGGIGVVKTSQIEKKLIQPGDLLIVIGGPSMRIGISGGATSSADSSDENIESNFASVQRGNAEMQRRAQEVISTCVSYGKENPIVSLHDVGAGGISNAMPELVNDADLGGIFYLEDVPVAEENMSPSEIWCNESQERFVLAVNPKSLNEFLEICSRERCPASVIGVATKAKSITVFSKELNKNVVDIPNHILFNKSFLKSRTIDTKQTAAKEQQKDTEQGSGDVDFSAVDLGQAIEKVISHPTVASKRFLITIVDRTVGGLTVQDQMVGKWQVPVSDVSVTRTSFGQTSGEAISMGEKPNIAVSDSMSASRMAAAEAITNILSADVTDLSKIIFSANWQAAPNENMEQNKALYDGVEALKQFCLDLGIVVPVGKDSLSMKASWKDKDSNIQSVISPVSLVITACSAVGNNQKNVLPELVDQKATKLIRINIKNNTQRLGGSIFSQVHSDQFNYFDSDFPDVDSSSTKNFFKLINKLKEEKVLLAYHDISDGGTFSATAEMSFSSKIGVTLDLEGNLINNLFAEEAGAIVQVGESDLEKVKEIASEFLMTENVEIIGGLNETQEFTINSQSSKVYSKPIAELEQSWTEFSKNIELLRDNPKTAQAEFDLIAKNNNGYTEHFDNDSVVKALSQDATKKKVAILREQGINGHIEMANSFFQEGHTVIDVHMTDLLNKRVDLNNFDVLVACGGFSYGDVLGAGKGWAQTILNNQHLREMFQNFFNNPNTTSLGVCNGCQLFLEIKELIPGTRSWGEITKNESQKFESRTVMVEVQNSNSQILNQLKKSTLKVPIAHGEGKFTFENRNFNENNVALKYVDSSHNETMDYPFNPNGSENGVAGLTSDDGRVTIMMPHPERLENTPWDLLFK